MYASCALVILLVSCLISSSTSATLSLPKSSSKDRQDLKVRAAEASPSIAALEEAPPSNTALTSTPTPFPIGSDLSLKINVLGSRIPFAFLEPRLYSARESIKASVAKQPNAPIREGRWTYGKWPEIQIIVVATRGHDITFSQLAIILKGLTRFVTEDNHLQARDLSYDILLEGEGKIGWGMLCHQPATSDEAAANITSTSPFEPQVASPPLNASTTVVTNSEKTWAPIEGTSMKLFFNFFGEPIPPGEFTQAFSATNLEILIAVSRIPHLPIPGDRFDYDRSNAHISIIGNRGRSIDFLQLFQILQTLYAFVSGVDPYAAHYQILQFEIWLDGSTQFGIGFLWYHPPMIATS